MITILRFILIFILGVSGVLATNILSFFGDSVWFLDYFSHFRLQYLGLLAIMASVFWLLGMRLFFAVAAILLVVNLYDYSSVYRQAAPSVAAADKQLSILSFNQWHYNQDYGAVLAALQASKADVILLHETSTPMLQVLLQLKWLYPYQYPLPERRGHSTAILSKYPWRWLHHTQFARLRALVVEFEAGGEPLTLIGVHPYSPVTPERKAVRDEHLMEIAAFAARQKNPVIIAGDFNATPWSAVFRRFIERSGLQTTVSWGHFRTTWPSWLPVFMQIPIDHILVSTHFGLVESRRLGSFGSDHYAIQSTLVLQEQSP